MKKIIIVSFVVMMVIGLAGCGGAGDATPDDAIKTTNSKVESVKEKINTNNEKKEKISDPLQYSRALLKYSLLVRECFEKASDRDKAIDCHREAAELLIKFKLEYDNKFVLERAEKHVGDWSDAKKADVLNNLDKEIELVKTNLELLKTKVE